jgi:signal transduction histidine kinase
VRERSPIRYALKTARRPLAASDVREHPLAAGIGELIERAKLKSLLVVPVTHLGRVVGSISAHQTRAPREWSEDDVDLLVAVATHVGATLENARLIAELREANRLKDQFLATLSHELRTPLTAINAWVEMLDGADGAAPATGRDLHDGIQAIGASATSLTRLISDLLDLSRVQRGVLRLNRDLIDINRAAATAELSVRQSALARGVELRVELADGLPRTIADGQRVQQILWNLLSNAIKFTRAGGSVVLRTRVAEDGAEETGARARWIELEVEDAGEGITPDFLPHVFERFRQADGSATRRHGGLGIGLSLVKELTEAHGGTVTAASEPGRGSRFTVRLPIVEFEEWLGSEKAKQ